MLLSDPYGNRTHLVLLFKRPPRQGGVVPLDHGTGESRDKSQEQSCCDSALDSSLLTLGSQLQVPVSSRAGRPYESRLGTCRTCKRVKCPESRVQSREPETGSRSIIRPLTLDSPLLTSSSSTGGIRTHKHQGLSFAAFPFAYRAKLLKRPRWDLNPRSPA